MRRLLVCVGIALLLGFAGIEPCPASRPVPKTITGCVENGVLLHASQGTVYPIHVRGLNLRPYEGKKILIKGSLLPGDRFNVRPGTLRILGYCGKRPAKQ